jgi:2-hydroxy-3-keto-5-methylthiopentenyl-1-phosphate phosphatase
MKKKLATIAIAYDFDGTLAPGNMQEHSFIPKLGIDAKIFWEEAKKLARLNDMDEILAYMQLMLQRATNEGLPVRKKDFEDYGKEISFFNGVEGYFDRINKYALEKDVKLEHYIISSGLREFIHGTKIAHQFKYIFASGFRYDSNEVATWPALAINYTNKTQFLFRINKGIQNSYDNSEINKYTPAEKRPIPFSQMIYIGDGETDVPAMKMIKYQGGTAIAVYNPKIRAKKDKSAPKQNCEDLIMQKRADYIAPTDYSDGSILDGLIKSIIDKIHAEIVLKNYTK